MFRVLTKKIISGKWPFEFQGIDFDELKNEILLKLQESDADSLRPTY
jgi:hypothetical protein